MRPPLGLHVVSDVLEQPLSRAAVEHAQHTGVCLGGKELEDGQHAARTDVIAVQETKGIGCRAQQQQQEGAGRDNRWGAGEGWVKMVNMQRTLMSLQSRKPRA